MRRLVVLLLLLVPVGSAHAATYSPKAFDAHLSAFKRSADQIPVRDPAMPAGAQALTYKFGPMDIKPGQNVINIDLQKQRPAVNGWIVSFRPGLVYAANGKSPSVKVVHLHHAVWLSGDSLLSLKPTFAAGEEKTNFNAPTGFGWRYTTDQAWVINHMIHNLTADETKVYLTYTLWFIPDSAPQAASITPVHTQWMDVQGVKPYPVFNALRHSGTKDRFTYPEQDPDAYKGDGVVRNRWVADHDGTMVQTAGHLHPGGLYTDLFITRDGVTKRIFRSRANYFEATGPVSWDVSMSATAGNWRVNFKKGDVISTDATYDTSRASWYEVMGIMPVAVTDAPVAGGVDPFAAGAQIDQSDTLTHGRLPENYDGTPKRNAAYHDATRLRPGPYVDKVTIKNFLFSQGDLTYPGAKGLPPRVLQGHTLSFVNADAPLTERFHTITACRAPCDKSTAIGFPLADGATDFDSGELGYGPTIDSGAYASGDTGSVPLTAVVDTPTAKANCKAVPGLAGALANGCVGTVVYKTPATLKPGTYTYFCRIHPFMRGAFKVVAKKRTRA